MRKLLPWLLVTLVFYLFSLFWKMPADRVYSHLANTGIFADDLVLTSEPQGSWNKGRITGLIFKKREISEIRWKLQPAALLLGRLQYAMSCELPQGESAWTLAIGPKTLSIKKLRGEFSTAILGVAVPGFEVSGSLELNDLGFTLNNGMLKKATGQMVWKEAGLGPPYNLAIGDLQLDLSTGPDGVKAIVSDTGGTIQTDTIVLLTENGRYSVDGTISARKGSPQDLVNFLQILGQPGSDGLIRFSYSGNIPRLE
jgi:hypothetical protein